MPWRDWKPLVACAAVMAVHHPALNNFQASDLMQVSHSVSQMLEDAQTLLLRNSSLSERTDNQAQPLALETINVAQQGATQVEQAGKTMQAAQQQQRQTGELKTAISVFRLV